MKKVWLLLLAFAFGVYTFAAEVTITKVQQRYPWNGLVDIEFEVPSATNVNFVAANLTRSTEIEMKTFFDSTGKTIEQPFQVAAGTHKITWNSNVDAPNTTKEEIRIYANDGQYCIRFNANGGKGTMSDQKFTFGIEKSLSSNTFTRDGYVFIGWATSADGDVVYTDGKLVSNLTSEANGIVNLFAIWELKSVQLWADGPYWAETNIGAENPEDYGYYFWWGDTIGYKRENDKWVASDGSSSNFSFEKSNTPTYGKSIATLQSEGWITSSGVLTPEHDAARAHWGENWRMPTDDEFDALCDNCTWTWTSFNGVNGYVVKGKGDYSSSSIFLPAAGRGGGTSLGLAGSSGSYWSSVPNSDTSYGSWYLYFGSIGRIVGYFDDRGIGHPVRPVSDVH